jgi:hypothetical protein
MGTLMRSFVVNNYLGREMGFNEDSNGLNFPIPICQV